MTPAVLVLLASAPCVYWTQGIDSRPALDSAAIKRIKAPVLGIYGENDARIDATLPAVVGQMQSAGKTFTQEVYPGTGHGFLKPGREGSDGPQPARAWTRILEFLRARLGK